jgi:hypothetical protein
MLFIFLISLTIHIPPYLCIYLNSNISTVKLYNIYLGRTYLILSRSCCVYFPLRRVLFLPPPTSWTSSARNEFSFTAVHQAFSHILADDKTAWFSPVESLNVWHKPNNIDEVWFSIYKILNMYVRILLTDLITFKTGKFH